MSLYKRLLIVLLSVSPFTQALSAPQPKKSKIQREKVASGFGIPWGIEFVSEKKMLITQRSGEIFLWDGERKKQLKRVPGIYHRGQGGLLDIKKHPDHPQEPWIYVSYAKTMTDGATTALARFQFKNNQIIKFNEIFVAKAQSPTTRHFGSRIAFDDRGYLFLSIGDRGQRDKAQDKSNHNGTILRLHADGRVPADNPFVSDKKSLPEIWSYGHRNPQGLAFDPQTKILWAIEHGPSRGR